MILLTLPLLLLLLPGPAEVEARIAVFVDGRVLRVDDAVLEGESIMLRLPGGGLLRLAATRIDRVVADEVVDEAESGQSQDEIDSLAALCDPGWVDLPLPEATPFRTEIRRAAHQAGLHPWLLATVVQVESGYDPAAESRAGARGLTQLMPAAAADWDVANVWDAEENLRGGASHLRHLINRFESLPLALAAYNAGAATVEKAGGVPAYRETRLYVKKVLEIYCPHVVGGPEDPPDGKGRRSDGEDRT